MSNKSIDKMAEQFTSLEELQAYCDSQYKTLLTLNQKINSQNEEIVKLQALNSSLKKDLAISNAGPKPEGQFTTTDEETICVIQIAMLKIVSMERELIMDETKRLEIFVKTLLAIRGREVKPTKNTTDGMSTAELLKQYDDQLKEPQ